MVWGSLSVARFKIFDVLTRAGIGLAALIVLFPLFLFFSILSITIIIITVHWSRTRLGQGGFRISSL